jgi:acetyl-CoA synthase
MPQELKDDMRERLEKRLAEMGQPELLDKIATEKDTVSVEELVEFLQKVEHPALTMASVLG